MDFTTLIEYSGGGLLALLTLLQIAPIHINPWSAIAKAIGKAINGEVIDDLREVKHQLDDLKANDTRQDKEHNRDKALDARRRILTFGDDCRRGVNHSKEHFDSIFDDINFYRHYCRENPDFENDKAVLTIQRIEEIYQKCINQNDFL